MSLILVLGIAIKGVAVGFELLIQYLITRQLGLSGYGLFSYYINLIDISFWLLFSGLVKSNTYYLSDITVSIKQFKGRYYTRFALPAYAALIIAAALLKNANLLLAAAIVLPHLYLMDSGSELLARGRYFDSLLGEYLIGRAIMAIALLVYVINKQTSISLLLAIYGLQYMAVILWLRFRGRSVWADIRNEEKVSAKKLWRFQFSDIATGLIGQSPVILQFIFVGSYETGFTAIVVLAKKVVNFISGPTAKTFLPQFAKLYKQNKKDEIKALFRLIIHLQMLFVGAVAVVLLGFTETVLSFFSPELLEFSTPFRVVAAVFLFVASFGPCGGLLQMTGCEKAENRLRWSTVGIMFLVMILMRHNRLFALYGMCTQALSEGIMKYIYICKWFNPPPVPIWQQILLWIPSLAISAIAVLCKISTSFIAVIPAVICTVLLSAAIELCDKETRNKVIARLTALRNSHPGPDSTERKRQKNGTKNH